eukprot:1395851-Amphidinium_carterae.1
MGFYYNQKTKDEATKLAPSTSFASSCQLFHGWVSLSIHSNCSSFVPTSATTITMRLPFVDVKMSSQSMTLIHAQAWAIEKDLVGLADIVYDFLQILWNHFDRRVLSLVVAKTARH